MLLNHFSNIKLNHDIVAIEMANNFKYLGVSF